MAKDENTIKNDLISLLLTYEPTADTQDGSLIRDINIDPQAAQISLLYNENDYVKKLAAWKNNAEEITTEDLDAIGANLNLTRKQATYATTVITFRAKILPTERIRIGNEDGTGGVQVKSMNLDDDTYYQFITTQTVYLEPTAELNTATGFYEVSAPATAVLAGSQSNVGVGTIVILEVPISGIDSIYNYVAATGGDEIQNNAEYAEMLSVALQGATKNTENGIKSILNTLDNITEIKIFNPNSEESTEAGMVYAYIKSNSEMVSNDELTFTINSNYYLLKKRPVKRIINVKAYYDGVLTDCVENVDYYLLQDKESIYSYSSDALDYIVFNYEKHPDPNSTFYVNYVYNSKIIEAQDLIKETEKDILILGNVLVKSASAVPVNITLDIKLKFGYNTQDNKDTIIGGIQTYINSFKMGQDLSATELFSFLVQKYTFIDSINYPFTTFKRRDGVTSDIITTTYGEYLIADENSLTVNFG